MTTQTAEKLATGLSQICAGMGTTLEAVAEIFQQIVSAIAQAAPRINEAALKAACEDPKLWHIYTHTKKRRIRKKCRKKLEASLARALQKEART